MQNQGNDANQKLNMKLSNWQGFKTIFVKEVVDNFRDKRTITTMALSIVIGPLLWFGMLWFIEKTIEEETDLVNGAAIELPVIGAQRAPGLISYLEQNNIEILSGPDNPEALVKSGKQRMVLVIGETFIDSFKAGKPAPVRLIHDSSISGLEKVGFEQVRRSIAYYASTIGRLRLQARGISPSSLQAIVVNESDVASPEARSGQVLGMLPYLLVMFIMIGGMYLAIDATAGEREKGSLEPLLCQPIHRKYVLLAKLFAASFFSAITFILVLLSLAISFKYVPIEMITVSISMEKIAIIFISCLPFVLLASAIMILVASFTKSYKEAQSYSSMAMLVPTLPLVFLGLLSPEPSSSNMWMPSLSQGLIIIETVKGEFIAKQLIGLSMITSLGLAILIAWIAIKLYERERILG